MTDKKKINLLLGLVIALFTFVLGLQFKLSEFSRRISSLEDILKVDKAQEVQLSVLQEPDLTHIYTRLSALEENIALPEKKALSVVKPAHHVKLEKKEAEQRAFLQGREQWQAEHMETLYVDSEKKAQLMVEHLKQQNLEGLKQERVFSILRDHFIEVAYVITDTQGHPTFDDFSAQLKKLNNDKEQRLVELLTEEELKQLNSVNWLNKFKENRL